MAEQRGGAGGEEHADLVAQFPGKVRKVLVAEGAQVAEGEPLVLVEAMKMEFAVKAPRAAAWRACSCARAELRRVIVSSPPRVPR